MLNWIGRTGYVAAVAALFAASPRDAGAVAITYSANFGPATLSDFNPDDGGTPIVVMLPALDTSLYDVTMLRGITITLIDSGAASIFITNTNAAARTSTSQSTSMSVMVTGPASLVTSDTLAATNGSVTVPGLQTTEISGLPVSSSASSTVPAVDWVSYEGGGTVDLTFLVTNSGAAVSGTGAASLSYRGDGLLSGIVMISYEMVPEPFSLALLGTGLVGVALIPRRRSGGPDQEMGAPK